MGRALRVVVAVVLLGVFAGAGCEEAQEPPHAQTIVLRGSAYERGRQHGERFEWHIRSLYTKLLTSSILPFLNREQLNIAPILTVYNGEDYRDGKFSYRLLLESGRHLYDNFFTDDMRDELRGIADGSGMPLDDIIILNTFVDTMLSFRAVVVFIQQIQTPFIDRMQFVGTLKEDGVDNDGDGRTDERNEDIVGDYDPRPTALMLEVPLDSQIRFVIEDRAFTGLACPDPRNIEPIGRLKVSAACVNPECVVAECSGKDELGRECFSAIGQDCLDPRLHVDCFDPNCIEAADPGCVDKGSIRVLYGEEHFLADDPAIAIRQLTEQEPPEGGSDNPHDLFCKGQVEVVFTPPGGLPRASVVAVSLQAGDRSPIYSPTPFHSRSMREERVTFTTAGYLAEHGTGDHRWQLGNLGLFDGRAQPPSLAFAARGSATKDGDPILAGHFALLDSNLVHDHAVVFTHVPEEGHAHTVLGWTGLAWGFMGMNAEGLAYAATSSDSLDNPLIGGMLEDILDPDNILKLLANPNLEGLAEVLGDRQLLAEGMPVGLVGRKLLERCTTVEEATQLLYDSGRTYGWNYLLADAQGGMVATEVAGGIQKDEDAPSDEPTDEPGFKLYGAEADVEGNLSSWGERLASVGPDDLRIASHFVENVDDIRPNLLMGPFSPKPQRQWTGFYYRSVRAWYVLGEVITERLGGIDAPVAVEILREPELVDTRDSMSAAVFEPAKRTIHWAMGAVPATSLPFIELDLKALAEEGQP